MSGQCRNSNGSSAPNLDPGLPVSCSRRNPEPTRPLPPVAPALDLAAVGLRPWVLSDEEWQRFKVPGLFLVGENEKIYSAKAALSRLNRVAPQIKAEIIPGAGHDLTFAQPDLVVRKITGFLSAT
jgi:pimeloyl-ACP methyl ester carboxylesterase